ncbi:MAG: DUF2202 domain-containing protein [Saprospiraceae bacterium]|nr:DUF2202 domain-containing protein [Saprospiraceae bacterium]
MKTTKNYLMILVLMLGTVFTFTQCEKDLQSKEMNNYALNHENGFGNNASIPGTNTSNANIDVGDCLSTHFTLEDLNEAEKDAILFMREEEKLARDVYSFLYERWTHPVFMNISRSEERHMTAMLCLIQRYGLEDPVGENERGVFINKELADLYPVFTEIGTRSLEDALTVGATIEDLDLADLQAAIEEDIINNADILAIFGELSKGSRNHLRAFSENLSRYGVDYTAQYISSEDFIEIIRTERERGGSICSGLTECSYDGTGNPDKCHGEATGICSADCNGSGTGNSSAPGNGRGKGQQKIGGPN